MVTTFLKSTLQAAESKKKDLEGRIEGLQMDVSDSRQKQGNMKGELKKFMDILDGKLDELHEFRQGLSKLGVDNWEKCCWAQKGERLGMKDSLKCLFRAETMRHLLPQSDVFSESISFGL